MEDFTKFCLKCDEELTALVEGKDNIAVIACNKCFKEFGGEEEPELGELAGFIDRCGKSIAAGIRADFLCNRTHAIKMLRNAGILTGSDVTGRGADSVFVISCGLGVQTIAGLVSLPVYAACDSISGEGNGKSHHSMSKSHHSMALTTKLCGACGRCYLNNTGGVCPVADCSKSLINGQCGGAKDGMCEADNDKECAWVKIYKSLSAAGRETVLTGADVQYRDYSKISFKFINDYVKAIRKKRFEGYYGGLYIHENKDMSGHLPISAYPLPARVVIPLSQHTGTPSKPLVKAGDRVKTGQKIGEADGFVSSPVHASISGCVTAVKPQRHPVTGLDVLSVVIESDGRDELHESVRSCGDYTDLTAEELTEIVRDKGIVGMGGAGFPAFVKLKSPKPIDTVLLNGCECEPYLTADHRVMLEYADDIITGLKIMLKATGAEKGIVAIEDNKPDAIMLFKEKTAGIADIEVVSARTKYPQGAEKMLIKRVLGRSVTGGALPLDAGVAVSNVSTAKAVTDAVSRGMPLIKRAVTVAGGCIGKPGNYMIRIGTSVKEIIGYCGGITGSDAEIRLGGPMMGSLLPGKPSTSPPFAGSLLTHTDSADLSVPVIKTTNGIIALQPSVSEQSACIRCGRCVDACPMELLPLYYPVYAGSRNWEGMKDKAVNDCIECGCCDFICPSKIPIRDKIKEGKSEIGNL